MRCPECEHDNPETNRFCGMCGSRLSSHSGERFFAALSTEPESHKLFSATAPAVIANAGADPQGQFADPDDILGLAIPAPSIQAAQVNREIRTHGLPAAEKSTVPREGTNGGIPLAASDRHAQGLQLQPAAVSASTSDIEEPDAISGSTGELGQILSEPPAESIGISGPSFLGLGGSSSGDYRYLVEDEESGGGHWVAGLVLVLLAAAAVFLVAKNWGPIKVWTVTRGTALAQHLHQAAGGQPAKLPTQSAQPAPAIASNAQALAPVQVQPGGNGQPEMVIQQASKNATSAPASGMQGAGQAGSAQASPASNSGVAATNAASAAPSEAATARALMEASSTAGNSSSGKASPAAGAAGEKQSASTETPAAGAEKKTLENNSNAVDERAAVEKNSGSGQQAPSAVARKRSPSTGEKRPAGDEMVAAGERYLYGRGVPRNCNQAMVYFQAGAEQQNPRALSRLGSMYATGTCVPLNRVMAYNWFSLALAHDRSNQLLEQNLNMLWREMSEKERQEVLQAKR